MPNNVPTTPRNVVVNPLHQGAAVGGEANNGNIRAPPPGIFNLPVHNSVPASQMYVVVNPPPQGAALGGHPFSGNITVPPPDNFNLSLHNNVPATQSNAVANPSPQEAVVGGTSSVYWYFNQISAPTAQNGEKISGDFFSPPRYQIVSAEEYEKNLMPSNVFGSSYIPYQGCNCIQMRSHAQMLSALDQMPPLSTSTPRYDDMQHLGATGNMDHYVVERAKPMMKKPYKCNFCAKNQEKDISHQLKSETGEVLCPILREIICKICGATQANAHTPKFCPQKHRNRREPMTLDRHFPPLREMNSSGT